jgi:hypothetical protein
MKTATNTPERFGTEAAVSSSSECDINKKYDLEQFSNSADSSLNKTPGSLEITTLL